MHSIGNPFATAAVPSNDTRNLREPSRPGSGPVSFQRNAGPGSEVNTAAIAHASVALFDGERRASAALDEKGMAPQGSIRDPGVATRKRGGFANMERALSARQLQLNEQLSAQAPRSDSVAGRARAVAKGAADNPKRAALAELHREIMKINLTGKPENIIGTFLRADSGGQRMIKKAIAGEFQPAAQQLMDKVFTTLQTSLASIGPNAPMKYVDEALTAAYKAMIEGFKAIEFPQSLDEVSKAISSSLDNAADMQAAKAASGMQEQIRNLSADLQRGINKALLLRLFTPHVFDIARGATAASKNTVDHLNGWLNAHPQAKLSGLSMSRFANMLTTNINGASGAKYDDLSLHFPMLIETMKQTRL